MLNALPQSQRIARTVIVMAGAMLCGSAASGAVVEAGGFSFSDEMGGFRILSASGSGSRLDPIVVVEEIEEAVPITLVIRRLRPSPRRPAMSNATSFNLVKQVANRSGRVWAGFELELQEVLRKPSVYGDGLSFNQFGAGEPDVESDAFAVNDRLFEPHDRIRFQNGHVDPDKQAQFRITITDPTPTAIFYLVQDPQLLSAHRLDVPRRFAGAAVPYQEHEAAALVVRLSEPFGPYAEFQMSTSKHPKSGPLDRPRNDVIDNPEIGGTKGSNAGKFDPAQEEGESTFEGDVMNDTTPQGGIDPGQRGRTNR